MLASESPGSDESHLAQCSLSKHCDILGWRWWWGGVDLSITLLRLSFSSSTSCVIPDQFCRSLLPFVCEHVSVGGHTPRQQHERAATWLKLTSVAGGRASGTQHPAASHSPTLPRYFVNMCICLRSRTPQWFRRNRRAGVLRTCTLCLPAPKYTSVSVCA